MTKRVFVTPTKGKIIPMPDGNGDLPQKGKEVTLNSYWYRREKDKDVVIGPLPAAEAAPPADADAVADPGVVTAAAAKSKK